MLKKTVKFCSLKLSLNLKHLIFHTCISVHHIRIVSHLLLCCSVSGLCKSNSNKSFKMLFFKHDVLLIRRSVPILASGS